MRGDFSRFTFDPKKHYTGVLLQQGRVQVDADWNEQQAINSHRLTTQARDLIGASGAPVDHAGFRIVATHGLAFDGVDDYVRVDVPRGLSFPGRHPFTLETWVNPALQGKGGTVLSKFSTTADDALGQAEYYLEVAPDGTVCFHRSGTTGAGSAGTGSPDIQTLRSIRPVPFGRYTHIAVVYDGDQGLLYLDGGLAGIASLTLEARETITSFLLGARLAGLPREGFYQGEVGETRVWSVTRSPEQLAHHMYDPLAGDEAGLAACWGFDDAVGNMARDRAGQGNDGVFGEAISDQPQRVRPVWLTRGRYYAEGVLCQNDENIDLAQQPDYPDGVLPVDAAERVSRLAYLDVWERSVTALEDPSIREVALGGPDTAVRSRLVWQVKLLPVDAEAISRDPGEPAQAWESFLWRAGWKATLRARRTRMGSALGNQLYRVEVHNRGGRYGWPRPHDGAVTPAPVERLLNQPGQVVLQDWVVDDHPWAVGDLVEVFSRQTDSRNAPGPLTRVTAADPATRTLTLDNLSPEMASHTGLCLRRVAGIKWSRENGAVAFPVSRMHADSGMVTLQSLGHDLDALKEGDWVEVADDASLLLGQSNPLCRVESIDRTHLQVVLSHLPPAFADSGARKGVRLIRWDQVRVSVEPGEDGPPALDTAQVQQWLLRTGVIPACANAWVDLEDGVQVYLGGEGRFETGDYWLIPSRSLTEDVEWPQGPSGPAALPPHGIQHRYADLALLEIGPRNITVHDRRQTFTPLTAEYVQKTGDTITGDLSIQGSLHASGQVTADSLAGTLDADSVGTDQLSDRSVTPSKLAEGVGTVPAGYSILGASAAPPPGFAYTGSTVVSANPQPAWEGVSLLPVPDGDPPAGTGLGLVTAAALGARIYAVLADGVLLEYDPASDQWTLKASLPMARQDFALAAGGDRLYVIGGVTDDGSRCPLNQAYHPASDSWETRAELPTPRSNLAAAALGGRIYATAGIESSGRESRVHQVYDPASDSWETLAELPTARSDLAMGVAAGRLYAVGGSRGKFLGIFGETLTAENEEYNPAEDRWSSHKAHLPGPVRNLAVASLGDGLYAIGGVGRSGLDSATRRYDPSSDLWQEQPPLPEPRGHHGAAVLDGDLYLIGGETGRGASREVLRASLASTLYVHRKV